MQDIQNPHDCAQAPQAAHVYNPSPLSVGVTVSTANATPVPYTWEPKPSSWTATACRPCCWRELPWGTWAGCRRPSSTSVRPFGWHPAASTATRVSHGLLTVLSLRAAVMLMMRQGAKHQLFPPLGFLVYKYYPKTLWCGQVRDTSVDL